MLTWNVLESSKKPLKNCKKVFPDKYCKYSGILDFDRCASFPSFNPQITRSCCLARDLGSTFSPSPTCLSLSHSLSLSLLLALFPKWKHAGMTEAGKRTCNAHPAMRTGRLTDTPRGGKKGGLVPGFHRNVMSDARWMGRTLMPAYALQAMLIMIPSSPRPRPDSRSVACTRLNLTDALHFTDVQIGTDRSRNCASSSSSSPQSLPRVVLMILASSRVTTAPHLHPSIIADRTPEPWRLTRTMYSSIFSTSFLLILQHFALHLRYHSSQPKL